MPNGSTHDQITFSSAPLVAGLSLWLTADPTSTLLMTSTFVFSGLMFGPDLDTRSVQSKRWGLLRFIWTPYRKLIRHRAIWSHGLIIGTAVRVLYIVVVLSLPSALVLYGLDIPPEIILSHLTSLSLYRYLEVFIGLELGAVSHSVADYTVSIYKRRIKRAKKRRPINSHR